MSLSSSCLYARTVAVGLLIIAALASIVDATDCIYARNMRDLQLNGRRIDLVRNVNFVLHPTKDPNVYQSVDANTPYPMTHQIILTHSGAVVTNAWSIRDILIVFEIDFKSGIPPLYITQTTTGTGTCDINNLPMNRRDFAKVTAIFATQPVSE